MSYFEDASLVYIPSAVKDNKTYSIKPTDGTGDLTFSRGSDIEATRVASNGYIEKAKVNLLLQSNTYSTTWTTTNTSVTGGQSGYDGSSDAWLLTKTDANGRIDQTISTSGVLRFSVYAKAGSLNYMRLRFTGSSNLSCFFDFTDGSTHNNDGFDASMENVGGGWYRCSFAGNIASVSSVQIYPADSTSSISGTSGNIYIQDAQLNYGLVAQEYVETTTTSVITGITNDMPRLDYSGGASCPSLLLEKNATNLIPQSEYISTSTWSTARVNIDSNSIVSPEGGSNGTYIEQQNSQTLGGAVFKNISFSAGNYTTSIFAKAGEKKFLNIGETASASGTFRTWFDLENGTIGTTHSGHTPKIEYFGNGWYRCSITYTANAGSFATIFYLSDSDNSTSVTDSGGLYIYGAQLEAGSYPTSYIPTYGTSASRTEETTQLLDMKANGITTTGAWSAFFDISQEQEGASNGDNSSFFYTYQSNLLSAILSARKYYNSNPEGNVRWYSNLDASTIGYSDTTNKKWAVVCNGTSVKVFTDGALKINYTGTNSHNSLGSMELRYGTSDRTSTSFSQFLLFPTAISDADAIALTA